MNNKIIKKKLKINECDYFYKFLNLNMQLYKDLYLKQKEEVNFLLTHNYNILNISEWTINQEFIFQKYLKKKKLKPELFYDLCKLFNINIAKFEKKKPWYNKNIRKKKNLKKKYKQNNNNIKKNDYKIKIEKNKNKNYSSTNSNVKKNMNNNKKKQKNKKNFSKNKKKKNEKK